MPTPPASSPSAGAPAFPVGGPTTTSWREHSLTRAGELQYLLDWITLTLDPDRKDRAIQTAADSIRAHLIAAREAAEGAAPQSRKMHWWSKLKRFVGGASVERANSNLDAAETGILQLAPLPYVEGQLQNLLAHVRGHLTESDPRRQRIEDIARLPREPLEKVERDAVVSAVRVASLESRREITRVRSFRNVLVVTACVLAAVAAGLIVLGSLKPEVVPLCFHPEANEIVCPTSVKPVAKKGQKAPTEQSPPSQVAVYDATRAAAGPWDLPSVALVGLIAAAVAGATTLGGIKGTTMPYSLPIALAVLKLPTGALTAFLGLQLMRGGFVPGLSALDSPAQILAWAIVFGYAQQLLTQFVDKQAQGVLNDVGRADRPVESSGGARSPTPVTAS